jgi:membrane protease YdiL (CAAX protease family)
MSHDSSPSVSRHETETSGPLTAFLAVAFGGSILLSLLIGLTGGPTSRFAGLSLSSMLFPALGVIVARAAYGSRLGIVWTRLPWRWLPFALLALPLAIHLIALPGLLLLAGHLPWVDWFTPGADGLYHPPAARHWGTLTATSLATRLALNALIGLIIVSLFAFFEEIGWRAFMLPRLIARLGVRRAALTSAVIWALWHMPFAISGVQHVDNVSPIALTLIDPIGHLGAGLFLAYLWLKTESIILVSLSHGALNNWGQYAFKYMTTSGNQDVLLLLFVNLALLAAGLLAFTFLEDPRPSRARNLQYI